MDLYASKFSKLADPKDGEEMGSGEDEDAMDEDAVDEAAEEKQPLRAAVKRKRGAGSHEEPPSDKESGKLGKAKPKASKVSKATEGGLRLTSFFEKQQIGRKPKSAK
jgi:hypothetical protein